MSGLRKQKEYDWKDSNLALFGSDLDKGVKKESAQTERAWQAVLQKNGKPTTIVWRIEQFKVVSWPTSDYGQFFSGDSYIVFNQRPNPENPDDLLMDIHFWIGKESSQDEYGTAAYKTVELDTLLDDRPIQHREVQNHESDLFRSYFDSITYLDGGCATGFRHVTPETYQSRLFHFHGKGSKVNVQEVPLSRRSLLSEDVYILDLGLQLYQWNGAKCNYDEKFKAVQYLLNLRDSRYGKAKSETVDENENEDDDHEFYNCLPDVPVDGQSQSNDVDQVDGNFEKKLFRLSDKTGRMDFQQVKSGHFSKNDLDKNDVFIIDSGKACYVWTGRMASVDERRNALTYAHKYLTSAPRPFLPVSVVPEGDEGKVEGFWDALS